MKNIFIVLIIFVYVDVVAQPSLLQSSNQQLIVDAVEDGVFIVRRCYQLQDATAATPTYFGWQNHDWFGETYSLGIKVKEGYYLSDLAIRPWIYDKKFEQYAESKKFAPILSVSEYRMLEDTSYQTLPYRGVLMKDISTHRVYLAQDIASFHQRGFSVDDSAGMKKGWLVWLVFDKPLEEQNNQKPTFLIYRSELIFDQEKEYYEIRDPVTNKHILSGFYVVPEITDIGQINFILTGILHRENDKWQIVRFQNSANSNTIQSHSVEDGLTPIIIQQTNEPDTPSRNRRRR